MRTCNDRLPKAGDQLIMSNKEIYYGIYYGTNEKKGLALSAKPLNWLAPQRGLEPRTR